MGPMPQLGLSEWGHCERDLEELETGLHESQDLPQLEVPGPGLMKPFLHFSDSDQLS